MQEAHNEKIEIAQKLRREAVERREKQQTYMKEEKIVQQINRDIGKGIRPSTALRQSGLNVLNMSNHRLA